MRNCKLNRNELSNQCNQNQRYVGVLSYFPPVGGGISQLSKSLCDCLEKNHIPVHKMQRAVLPTRRSWGLISTILGKGFLQQFKIMLMFLRSFKKCRIYHVLSFSYLGFLPTVVATLMYKITGKNLVIAYHGGKGEEFLGRWGRIAKKFLQRPDLLIVASTFLKDVFQNHGLKAVKVLDVYPQTEFFFKKRNVFEPRFIMTRALEKIYRHDCALLAYTQVKETFPNASLTIVGTGSLESMLRKIVRDLNIDDVTFVGYVDHKEMQRYYDESDIYLNPTYPDNVSPSVLEAFACGLPVGPGKSQREAAKCITSQKLGNLKASTKDTFPVSTEL